MLPRWFKWNPPHWARPWQDELRILVQPHSLILLRMKRQPGRKMVDYEEVWINEIPDAELNLPGGSSQFSGQEQRGNDAKSIIATLHKQLQSRRWQGCRPRVAISNPLMHYVVVPWNAALGGREEQDAFIRHGFTQAYGDARDWDIRSTPPKYGVTRLASAIDQDFLQALRETFRQAGMPVRHIHPHLMMAINMLRQQLGRHTITDSFSFVMLEHQQLVIALIRQGQWLSLQSYAAEHALEEQLQALLGREAIIAGVDNSQWPVVFYTTTRTEKVSLPGYKVYNLLHHAQLHHGLEAWH